MRKRLWLGRWLQGRHGPGGPFGAGLGRAATVVDRQKPSLGKARQAGVVLLLRLPAGQKGVQPAEDRAIVEAAGLLQLQDAQEGRGAVPGLALHRARPRGQPLALTWSLACGGYGERPLVLWEQ